MAKINLIFLLVFLGLARIGFAQSYSYGFVVEFNDKAGTSFSINHPEQFLSQRAIERRAKRGIEITNQDFPVNDGYVDSLEHWNAKLHTTSRWMNSAVYLTNSSVFDDSVLTCSFVKSAKLVYHTTLVKSAKHYNKFGTTDRLNVPTDINYGASTNQITMCNAQILHNQDFLGQGMVIAVLDGGFWRANELSCFESLFQSNRVLGTFDFVNGDSLVYDDDTHGTNVLSTMAADLPGELIGSAPQASYWLLRTENVNTEFPIEEENWIAGAEFADSAGADVITASLGYSLFDDSTMNHTYQDMDGKTTRISRAADIAFSKGMMVINSAGNEGNNPWHYITAPGDGVNVLCIGAVDANKEKAYFSSFGPSPDGRIKPDVDAQGLATALALTDGTIGQGSGTSFSCPLVAGMIACLWQARPELTNIELLNVIRQSADRYQNPDAGYGYGIPDFAKALMMIDHVDYSEFNTDKLIKVYPNPMADELTIEFFSSDEQELNIDLYTLTGQKVFSENRHVKMTSFNRFTIDHLNGLGTGLYFLYIKTPTHTYHQSVFK